MDVVNSDDGCAGKSCRLLTEGSLDVAGRLSLNGRAGGVTLTSALELAIRTLMEGYARGTVYSSTHYTTT